MARETMAQPASGRLARKLSTIGQRLLLAPEGVIIFGLLVAFVILGGQQGIALLVAALTVWFIARMVALHLGRVALEAARYREAGALLQVAMALYPWSADTLALRGTLSLACGAPEAAVRDLQRAMQLLPGRPTYAIGLSSALLDLGRSIEAAAAARQALAFDDRQPLAYLVLAEAERASGVPLRHVEDWLRRGIAVAHDPEVTAALQCALASCLFADERTAEAMLALHTAEALLSRCAVARQAELRFYLGELLTARGQIERAREHYRSAESLDPEGRHAAAVWRGARL